MGAEANVQQKMQTNRKYFKAKDQPFREQKNGLKLNSSILQPFDK
jgi:hypothetical protein